MAASHQPPTERDLELLSAYLDSEISDRERITLERRLDHEIALQRELTELRDTVALLNDLPRLKAPRNFTLDPEHYTRTAPWWKRLLSLENTLQLSGAIGAAASVVLIILALVVNSGNLTRESHRHDAAANESVALQPSPSPAPTMTLYTDHLDQTAIAYAGEDLLQTTMMAQSTLYAIPPVVEGTPIPGFSAVESTTAETSDVPADQSEAAETLMLDDAVAAQADAIDGVISGGEPEIATAQIAEEAPAPLAAGESEAEAFGFMSEGQVEPNSPQAEPLTSAPSGSALSPSTTDEIALATPTVIARTATAIPADSEADSGGLGVGQTFREAQDSDSSEAVEVETQTVTPTPQGVAQAPIEQAQQQPAAKFGTEERPTSETSSGALLLAAAGVILFALSIGLLILGRKKAHRA